MAALKISLQPVTYTDIEIMAQISASSFVNDKHTQIKQLGRSPFDMAAVGRSELMRNLGIERCAYMKAVDEDTGEILGSCGWAFRVPDNSVVPRFDPGPPPEAKPAANNDGEKEEDKKDAQDAQEDTKKKNETDGQQDSIDLLGALEDADMKRWMEILMPPKTDCMYILGMAVTPSAHGKGVGSALMKWGTDAADRLGLFTWVHSSESAWKFYAKHGFAVVGELDIDMDKWAPQPPPEGKGEKWGHYVIRYMKRPVKGT